jgi:hypothetical protein
MELVKVETSEEAGQKWREMRETSATVKEHGKVSFAGSVHVLK